MKIEITINGKPGLFDKQTRMACYLPKDYHLMETAMNGIVDVIELPSGKIANLVWFEASAAHDITFHVGPSHAYDLKHVIR